MVFKHITFRPEITDENQYNYSPIYVLLDDNLESEVAKAMAQAISLDIRGDYDFFLSRSKEKTEQTENTEYEWQGNLYKIKVNNLLGTVSISYLLSEGKEELVTKLVEWNEALLDWKEFYLSELGFKVSTSEAFNHMFGVLILAHDLLSDKCVDNEIISEAIKRCSRRFGVNSSVIYRDCRKVTGLYSIELFFHWVNGLLGTGEVTRRTLYEFVNENIYNIMKEEDFDSALRKYIGV